MKKKFNLSKKFSLITGAAGLLGKSHALALAEIGSSLILTDLRLKQLSNLKNMLTKKFPAIKIYCFKMDVTKENDVKKILNILKKENINVSVLINNADLNSDYINLKKHNHIFENFNLKYWKKNLDIGLTGTFICSKIFGTHMSKNKGGVILNIASDLSIISPDQRLYKQKNIGEKEQNVKPVTYSVIKSGIVGLTKYLATYWADSNVRCNALSPGGIYNNQDPNFVSRVSELIPLGRMANLDEYQNAIQFLCSPASSYMTGHNLVIDGGRTIW